MSSYSRGENTDGIRICSSRSPKRKQKGNHLAVSLRHDTTHSGCSRGKVNFLQSCWAVVSSSNIWWMLLPLWTKIASVSFGVTRGSFERLYTMGLRTQYRTATTMLISTSSGNDTSYPPPILAARVICNSVIKMLWPLHATFERYGKYFIELLSFGDIFQGRSFHYCYRKPTMGRDHPRSYAWPDLIRQTRPGGAGLPAQEESNYLGNLQGWDIREVRSLCLYDRISKVLPPSHARANFPQASVQAAESG